MTTVGAVIGTLILFLPTPHGAYLAADSRHDGGDPALADKANKIHLCGKYGAAAIAGSLRIDVKSGEGEASIDLEALLEKLCKAPPDLPLAEYLSLSVAAPLHDFFGKHFARQPAGARMSERLGAPSVATIVVLEGAPGKPGRLYQIVFPFIEVQAGPGWLHELSQPVIKEMDASRPLAQGRTYCMGIRPDHPPAVETREQTLDTLRGLFARTREDAACRATIGGPIRVVVLEPDGARWITE